MTAYKLEDDLPKSCSPKLIRLTFSAAYWRSSLFTGDTATQTLSSAICAHWVRKRYGHIVRPGIASSLKPKGKTIREHHRFLLLNVPHQQTRILYQRVHFDTSVFFVSKKALLLADVESKLSEISESQLWSQWVYPFQRRGTARGERRFTGCRFCTVSFFCLAKLDWLVDTQILQEVGVAWPSYFVLLATLAGPQHGIILVARKKMSPTHSLKLAHQLPLFSM